MKSALAFLLLMFSATYADASMKRCTEPASLVRMTTYFHLRGGEFGSFAAALHRFATSEGFVYSRATATRSRSGQLDAWLVIRNTGPAIRVRSTTDEAASGRSMVVAEMAECRNDTQTPWLPTWTKFYHFVQRFASGARR